MHRLRFLPLAIAALGAVGGCSSLTPPTLGGAPKQPAAAADPVSQPGQPNAYETAFMVQGTPTAIYALVARGVLNCWLGAAGPLHATHVYAAEAAPPNQGGAAEIVLHERDPTFRDQRGPRAVRVRFEHAQGGVRVGFVNLRLGAALAEAMSQDTATWARGGSGCRVRELREPALLTGGTRAPPPPNVGGGGHR
ncbi:MAG TPA: hypothetical protein VN523_09550 [Hyphomicrobiaceae bacterium]|jgi:hypothetical protein|nr:hypothetical protein [Hyphomicrobiaceae bacterium]